jgi:hypothetical protein
MSPRRLVVAEPGRDLVRGILARRSNRCSTSPASNALIQQIRGCVNSWYENANPCTWTATTGEVLATVRLARTNMKKPDRNRSK